MAEVKGDYRKDLHRDRYLQRTHLILPAMTSRSADYHIFGQNQYLAAGLVSVFCNAVESKFACGNSCFIGLDGWREAEPIESPYGQLAPGVFQVGGKHAGPLGRREAALVVAELDLIRTTDQKPRPQNQAAPLRLVAHLPLLFSTEDGARRSATDIPERVSRMRPSVRNIGKLETFEEAALHIERAASAARENGKDLRTNATSPSLSWSEIEEGLRTLELFADDAYWLQRRTDAFLKHSFEHPSIDPLPALMDWIYVDDHFDSSKYSIDCDAPPNPLESDLPLIFAPPWKTNDSQS
jgi:hypothetical protein